MIIHAGGDRTDMVEPFLDFGDISTIVEGDGGGGGAQGVGAKAWDVLDDARSLSVRFDDLIRLLTKSF